MSGYFWKRRFFCPLSKQKPPHVAYSDSFLPVDTKTLRRMELRLQALQGVLCMVYDMMISYWKTSVLSVHTISRHFKNLLSGECFWKHALSLTVFTGYVWTVAVADQGEGSRGPGPPLIYRPNWGPKGWKKIGRPSPPLSQGLDDCPPLIWWTGSTTELAKQGGGGELISFSNRYVWAWPTKEII